MKRKITITYETNTVEESDDFLTSIGVLLFKYTRTIKDFEIEHNDLENSMNVNKIVFLADSFEDETMKDFFEKENIKSPNYLKDCLITHTNIAEGCDCGCIQIYKKDYELMYKYDEDTERFVKCSGDDENCIDNFVFYVCKDCNKVSCYIEY